MDHQLSRYHQSQPTFEYRQLSQNHKEIRLLHVQASQAQDWDYEDEDKVLIRCSLQHASLNDSPRYAALSHVWDW